MKKRIYTADPRTKLVWLILANVSFFLPTTLFSSSLIFLYFFGLLIVQTKWKKAIIYLGIFSVSSFLLESAFFRLEKGGGVIILMGVTTLLKLLPCVMAGSLVFSTTSANEWICGLKKLNVPYQITIPLTVLFRFFPTIRTDYRQIRNAMKFRGIAVNTRELLYHPLQTMEFIVIPLLVNANYTTTTLSAAALTRGISTPLEHTSYRQLKFSYVDFMVSALGVLVVGFAWGIGAVL